jgi:hypothetical protein
MFPVPVFMDAVADFALVEPEASAGVGHPLPISFRSHLCCLLFIMLRFIFFYHLPFCLVLLLRALRQVLSRIYFILLVRGSDIRAFFRTCWFCFQKIDRVTGLLASLLFTSL